VRIAAVGLLALTLACAGGDAVSPADAGGSIDSAAADAPERADAGGSPGPTAAEGIAELRASVLNLEQGWKFRVDPDDAGLALGWYAEDLADSDWVELDAGRTWEEQGFDGYDGVGWYRLHLAIPAEWDGAPVQLVASGVDDEYDVFVNGELLAHHGEWPDRSVWGWKTKTAVEAALRPGEDNLIAVRVNDWGGDGGLWRRVELRRHVSIAPYQHLLPEPVIDDQPEWVAMYWRAWDLAWNKVSFGTERNGLADAYMDEGFNEQIYQWDSSFITLLGRYGMRLFPVMATLDNFYSKQRPDGYIQRVYSETDGDELEVPTADEPVVNPPLFAWVEWEYYLFSGDASRLAGVLPVLERYYRWLGDHVRCSDCGGLYFQTGLGSGMDNTPRGDVWRGAWIDMSAQQALAARSLARIAEVVGDSTKAETWRQEHDSLAAAINARLYSEADGFYYDRADGADGALAGVEHIGAFWTLLAGVAEGERASRLVAHLEDPSEFYRPHLFPSLAASEPDYSPDGHYWRGGVWAPTNYMTIKGLEDAGFSDLARRAAENHLGNMAMVIASPPDDPSRIAPEERCEDCRTIWECYAPEHPSPGTRWDGQYLCRQDFVGWSGLGPIALLFENVIGLRALGAENTIVWEVTRTDRHGVRRMPLGATNWVTLVAEARASADAGLSIYARGDAPFTLEIRRPGESPQRIDVAAGESQLSLP